MTRDQGSAARPAERSALELAQTARARFETTAAAAATYGFDPERVKTCGDRLLEHIHRGSAQGHPLWAVETAQAMLTAVMAVNREPLPVSGQVDPASFAVSVLRDLAREAAAREVDWPQLEEASAACLRDAEAAGYTNLETYWALNRATAALELARAQHLAGQEPPEA